TQQQQITGYAMMKGWQIAEFFTERGVSGSVSLADRFQGQRMLAVLQPGDVVITAKLDRAFRSAANALGTLEQLKEDGIGLHMIDRGGDVCGNGISKLVFTILSAVAENERDRIRERVRDVKRQAPRSCCSMAASGLSGSMSRARARTSTLSRTPLNKQRWPAARPCRARAQPFARSPRYGPMS